MADKKVIMVGGRRAGKSTILASMMEIFNNNATIRDNYINLQVRKDKGDNSAVSLEAKRANLIDFIRKHTPGFLYLVDFDMDENFNHYTFRGTIPDGKGGRYFGNITIEFVDCPGESYGYNSEKYDELTKHFASADTFIIVVDTPYLMGQESDSGKFNQVNLCTNITLLFQQLVKFKSPYDFKKVIFVPVKCETWEHNIDTVSQKLQEHNYYGPLINYFKTDNRWSVSIIPAFTAGAIKFVEFGIPYIEKNTMKRCSRLGNSSNYRFADDGKTRPLSSADVIPNDEYTQHFPFYSWYQNTSNTYSPRNCEQIALHIWRFIVYKTQVELDESLIPPILKGFPRLGVLRSSVQKMQRGGCIKDSGKGICNIQLIERF